MANRIPLIVDRDDQNKLKELPVGDNLNLTGSGIVGAANIEATGLTIAGVSYNPFSGSYNDLTDKPNVAADTDELPEGDSNLFFTNERVDDRVAAILVEGTGIDINYDDLSGRITITNTGGGEGGGGGITTSLSGLATNQVLKWSGADSAWVNGSVVWNEIQSTPSFATVATTGSYNDLLNKPSLVNDISDLSDVDTTSTQPTTGQVLKWDGSRWAPADDITSGGGGLDATTLNGFGGSYYLDYNNFTNTPTLFDGDWSSLVGTPTTLSGYGITDAVTTSGSYTQNGSVTFNDNNGIVVGGNSNISIKVDNDVIIATSVDEQDLDIRVKPVSGEVSAIKVDTGTQRVGIFTSNPTHKLTVSGDVNAVSFIGSGASLSGITLSQVLTAGSETDNSVSFGNVTPYTANTYNLGASNNRYQNVYANFYYGDGSNLTGITSSQVSGLSNVATSGAYGDISGTPILATVATTGVYADLTSKPNIPSDLTDLGISDGTNGHVLTTDGNGNFTFQAGGDSVGNFTFSSSTISTDDSSAITIVQGVTMQSDLTVDGTITVNDIVSTSTGVPTIDSASSINLSATDRVVINKSPLNFANFTTAERDALAATNGDMIYNESTNKFQGYANGSWVDLH